MGNNIKICPKCMVISFMQMFDWNDKINTNKKYETIYDYIHIFYFIRFTLLSRKIWCKNWNTFELISTCANINCMFKGTALTYINENKNKRNRLLVNYTSLVQERITLVSHIKQESLKWKTKRCLKNDISYRLPKLNEET